MKQYLILKDFDGSQDGHDFHAFRAGTTRPLSPSLAAIAVKEGWARDAGLAAADIANAPPELAAAVLDAVAGLDVPEGARDHDLGNPA